MAITTKSNIEFIEQQYSNFILTTLEDGLLPENFYRNVSDFGSGQSIQIKTVGEVTLQEMAEDTPFHYDPIDSGEVFLTITDYPGRGWYVTDEMKEDGTDIDRLISEQARQTTRKIQEYFETRLLQVAADAFAVGSPHNVNGFPHLMIGSGTGQIMDLEDLIGLRLSFNKAEVPMAGRIGIVDPVVEATFNVVYKIESGSGDLAANEIYQMMNESGIAKDHSFITRRFGFDIITSNRLPTLAAGVATDGTATVATAAVANIFMCVADDNCKPLMAAWRRLPRAEGGRNKDLHRDEYTESARFGVGIQRTDTLGVIWTSSTLYK